MYTIRDGTLTLPVDESIYSRDCLLRTAYWFTDRCYIFITREAAGTFHVTLKAKPATLEHPAPEPLEAVAGEFCNALLDFELRERIETRTGRVRELIVAKAFSASGLLDDAPPGEVRDPVAKQPLVLLGAVAAE